MIGHPLSSSSIYNDPWHPLCSVYELDSPLGLKSKNRIQYSDATGVEISSYDVNGALARRRASCGSIVVESIHAALPYIKRSHPTSMPRPALSVVARSVSMLVVGSCKHRRRPTDRPPANNSTTDAAAAITFITAPFHRSLAQ